MLKSFLQYIKEANRVDGVFGGAGEDKTTDLEKWEEEKKKKSKKKEKPVQDEKTEAEINDDLKDKADKCPRCGKTRDDCKCQKEDYQSTVNIYRQKPGTVTKY
jgi:hypothetical protein